MILVFLFLTFFVFFIPGDVLLKRYHFNILTRFTLGIILGIVLWGWQGFIGGYLNIRWITYPYIVIFLFLWIKNKQYVFKKEKFSVDFVLFSIILLGSFIQVSRVWFVGFRNTNGIYLCCGEIMDVLWHLSLTNQLVKQIPPFEPGMQGILLENYHYWSNLVVADLVRVFHVSIIETQYHYIPIVLSLLLGLSAIVFGKLNKLETNCVRWLTFFLYFGGDAIFLLIFLLGNGVNFSMSSLVDGARFLDNPPTAFSIIIFLAGISLLTVLFKEKDITSKIIVSLLFGSLVGFKIYMSIFVFVGFFAFSVYAIRKKQFNVVIPFVLFVIFSGIIYLLVDVKAGGLYYSGFWRYEEFIVQPALGLSHLELARIIYFNDKKWLKVYMYETLYIGIYFFAIFGTKLIGIIQTKKTLQKLPMEMHIFLLPAVLVCLVIGSFFGQNIGEANTFQFLGIVFIIFSIYTALICTYLLKKIPKMLAIPVMLLIVIATIPRVIREGYLVYDRLHTKDVIQISDDELDAFNYLRKNTQKSAVIVVDPRSFFLDYITPYMSFFADRPMFLSGQRVMSSHDVDMVQRSGLLHTFIYSLDPKQVQSLLVDNNISYIVSSPSAHLASSTISAQFLETVYQNRSVKVVKVRNEK